MFPRTKKRTDRGQGIVEYVLTISFMVIFLLVVMIAIGPEIRDMFFDDIGDEANEKREERMESTVDDDS